MIVSTYKDKKTKLYGFEIYIMILFPYYKSPAIYETSVDAYTAGEEWVKANE